MPAVPPPPPAPALKPGEMLFNFQDADLQALIKTMSQITGRNFLLDPRTRGKVTIISSKPVPKASAYQIFISALKAQGFTTVEGPGGIVKIVPEAEAKQAATVGGADKPPKSDQWITQVVVVQHASASQLVQLLRPLLSPHALLSVYSPSNALIVTDTAAGIRNLMGVIEQIDRPGSTEVTIVPLQHASANDIAQLIARLDTQAGVAAPAVPGQPAVPQAQAQAESRLVIVPDARTNSLLIRSDNPGRVDQIRSLIAKLDVPARIGGNTRVVFLRNADAVKLAEILRGLLAGEARASTSSPASAPLSGAPTAGLTGGLGAAGLGGATAATAAAPKIEASLIQADQATNSLIISASDAVYNNLRAVIEQLDGRRAQVFVEALIAEVSAQKAAQLGIQWSGGGAVGSSTGVGATNFPSSGAGIIGSMVDIGATATTLGTTAGLLVGFLGNTITLPDGTQVQGFRGLARALEEKSDANILSTPNLLTVDNVESKIVVGQNVPFLTGSFAQATGTGTSVNPFQTIERKDVGLTLKIKPQITEGSGVKLQIYQEISSVAPGTGTGAADLITNKRSIDTTVIAEDGNIVVLGGLIQDEVNESIQGVPIVSSIPVLGELFKYRNRSKKKTNLMVFLRPVIVRSPEDMLGFTNERYEYMRLHERKTAMDRATLLPRYRPPVMPPYTPPPPKPAPAAETPEAPTAAPEAAPPAVPAAPAANGAAAPANGPAAPDQPVAEQPRAGERPPRSGTEAGAAALTPAPTPAQGRPEDVPPPPPMPAGRLPAGDTPGGMPAPLGPPDNAPVGANGAKPATTP